MGFASTGTSELVPEMGCVGGVFGGETASTEVALLGLGTACGGVFGGKIDSTEVSLLGLATAGGFESSARSGPDEELPCS